MSAQGCVVYRSQRRCRPQVLSVCGQLIVEQTEEGIGRRTSQAVHAAGGAVLRLSWSSPWLVANRCVCWPHHHYPFCFSLVARECEVDPRPRLGESQHTLVENRRMHVGSSCSDSHGRRATLFSKNPNARRRSARERPCSCAVRHTYAGHASSTPMTTRVEISVFTRNHCLHFCVRTRLWRQR